MHAPPKPCGPAGFDAFLRIAQRGDPLHHRSRPIPRPSHPRRRLGDRPVCVTKFPSIPANRSGKRAYHLDLFASQNFPPSPQIEVAKGLTTTREITPPLAFCVTNAPDRKSVV